MNRKPWITTISTAAVASLALAAIPAQASQYDYARVVSAEPIIRYVTVTRPVRECWDDVEYYSVDHRPASVAGGTIVGGIIGGVIGNQFGRGRGKEAATVFGTLVGAAIGNDAATRSAIRDGRYRTTQYSRPVRRCQTNYTSHQEERIDGYRVIYAYHGRKYETTTPYEPGNKIRIRVDVRPVSY